jgi:hypothetical protein
MLDSRKQMCPEVNIVKTKYIFMSHHQNVGQNDNVEVANESFEISDFWPLTAVIVKGYYLIR